MTKVKGLRPSVNRGYDRQTAKRYELLLKAPLISVHFVPDPFLRLIRENLKGAIFLNKFRMLMLLAITVFLLGVVNVFDATAAPKPPKVLIDGEELVIKGQQPMSIKGSTFLPLRVIFEALEAQVTWDNAAQKLTATKEDPTLIEFFGHKKIELKLGEPQALLNGEKVVKLASPARKVNGSVMVPLRFVAEALDAQISWNSKANTVEIFTTEFDEFIYTQNNDGSETSYITNIEEIPENPSTGKELVYLLVYQKHGLAVMYYSALTSIVDLNKNDGSKERLQVISQGNLTSENMWIGNYDIFSSEPDTEEVNYHKFGSIHALAKQATNDNGELIPDEFDYSYFPLTIGQAMNNSRIVTNNAHD